VKKWTLFALGVLSFATIPAGRGHIDLSMAIIGAGFLLSALILMINES
jgi:hypothetical protein